MQTNKNSKVSPQGKLLASCDFALDSLKLTPFVMIIFGGAGDLSRRKLIPSLYRLYQGKQIGEFSIVAVGRSKRTDAEFRAIMQEWCQKMLPKDFSVSSWNEFSSSIHYESLDVQDSDSYSQLCAITKKLLEQNKSSNLLYYLAVPPKTVPGIVANLENKKMCRENIGAKIIIEKPFGHDKETAIRLNQILLEAFDERQIYRIDHFLGKQTVQNILFFRFANAIFEPIWKRNYIEYVEINATESLGVGERGAFYEQAGILRDMVQNHMLQILAMVAMEPPVGFAADFIRDEKVKVFQSLRSVTGDDIGENSFVAQYGSGVINGEKVPAYRDEPGVDKNSATPTYFAGTFYVDNWRWADVPFYLKTGKRLQQDVTEVKIVFKQPPLKLLGRVCDEMNPNILTITIKPHEKIGLTFGVKRPRTLAHPHQVDMIFNYDEAFKESTSYSPYERLLLDCMRGDQTLFTRQDEIEATWSIIDPIIEYWDQYFLTNNIHIHAAGEDV